MFYAILVLLHPTSRYSEYNSTLKYTLRSLRSMWVGLLRDRIWNNELERSNSINKHTLNCEPVPLSGPDKKIAGKATALKLQFVKRTVTWLKIKKL